MGQLITVYHADSEFMADAVRDLLAAEGVRSVRLLNEIPMQPGFTFEVKPYAEILVDESDLEQAGEIVAGAGGLMQASGNATAFPSTIRFNTSSVFSGLYIAQLLVLVFGAILEAVLNESTGLFESAWVVAVIVLELLLALLFVYLNWPMVSEKLLAAIVGLLVLPFIAVWVACLLVIRLLLSIYNGIRVLGRIENRHYGQSR